MTEFLAMGGYAEYVWSVFGLAVVTLIYNVLSARRRMRVVLEKVTLNMARHAARARRKQMQAENPT
jgi:heme exporter protein CcmD